MPTKVNREEFLRRLESVQPGLSLREVVDQSDCFVFLGGRVTSFNDEVACSYESLLGDEFVGAVKAAKLLEILGKLPDEELEVEAGDGEMILRGKRRRTGVRMEKDAVDHSSSIQQPETWRKINPDFGEAVGIVQQCAGNDQSRFKSTCVYVHPEWVEACDDVQLCRWRLKNAIEEPFLIRKNAVRHVSSLGMVELSEADSWIHFRSGSGLVMSCRRYMEEYPDLEPVFKVVGRKISLPKGLAEATDRAHVFSQENTDHDLVKVEMRPGKVRIKGEGVSGWYVEPKKVKYDGPSFEFFIAPKLLMDIVTKHNEIIISKDRLKVDAGSYEYATCLIVPDDAKDEPDGGEDGGGD